MKQNTKNQIAIEINENKWILLSLCCILAGGGLFFSCSSKVPSLLDPDKHVTLSDLHAEIDTFLVMAETRMAQLEQKDKLRALLFRHSLIFAETGAVNPVAIITTMLSILGIGAVGDNIKKRKIIRENGKTVIT